MALTAMVFIARISREAGARAADNDNDRTDDQVVIHLSGPVFRFGRAHRGRADADKRASRFAVAGHVRGDDG